MPEQFMSTAVLMGIIVVGLIIVLTAIFSTWKKVPADKAAIVTGLGKAKVITGRAASWCCPFCSGSTTSHWKISVLM